MLREWLQDALKRAGVSQAALARAFSDQLGRPFDRGTVNKMLTGVRGMSAEEMLVAAKFLHAALPAGVSRTVPLRGYVGAGQTVYWFEDDAADYVEAPPDAAPETNAVEVQGESMLPLYEDRTILYYSKQLPPEMMSGKRCILKLDDDRVLVKTLRRGSERGLWTLVSLNAPDIEDVGVQWAAPIEWVKPAP